MGRDSPLEKSLRNKNSVNGFLDSLHHLTSSGIQNKLSLVISHINLTKTISFEDGQIEIIIDGIIDLFTALGLLDTNNGKKVEEIFRNLINYFKDINKPVRNIFNRVFHLAVLKPAEYRTWYREYVWRNMLYIDILKAVREFIKNIPVQPIDKSFVRSVKNEKMDGV